VGGWLKDRRDGVVDGVVAALALQWLPPLALWLFLVLVPGLWVAAVCMALLMVLAVQIKKIAPI
jgi:hypothetical protein